MPPKLRSTSARDGLSEAMEDVLKALLKSEVSGKTAATSSLASLLGVTPSAVSQVVGKLRDMSLVEMVARGKPCLTEAGRDIAKEMLRHHRLLELFLTKALGYSWDEAHPEAERLEHHISENLEAAIDAHLGHPTHDPHGSPIPTADLELVPEDLVSLSALAVGDRGTVRRVAGFDPALLRHLKSIGVVPGALFRVEGLDPYGAGFILGVEGKGEPVCLAVEAARQVGVDPLEGNA